MRAFGLTAGLTDRIRGSVELEDIDVGGVGGTLAGNALSLAAMCAALTEVLTDDAYAHMLPGAALGPTVSPRCSAGTGCRGTSPARRGRRPTSWWFT